MLSDELYSDLYTPTGHNNVVDSMLLHVIIVHSLLYPIIILIMCAYTVHTDDNYLMVLIMMSVSKHAALCP